MSDSFSFGQFPPGLAGGDGGSFGDFRWGEMSGLGRAGTQYPSPFFDGSQMYLPKTMKRLFRWCRYYFFTNPLVNAVCYKMASYPITDLLFEHPHSGVARKYEHLKDRVLNYRQFLVGVGLDYQVYGNAFVSISYPMTKFLICGHCKHAAPARQLRGKYRWRNLRFELRCPKCGKQGEAVQEDVPLRNPQGIRLVRWDPERIEIDHIEETGDTEYYYRMNPRTVNRIVLGKPHVIETIPAVFIEAARKKLPIRFKPGQVFHLNRPTISGKDQGWGMPRILPVLQDVFYLRILKKGQEMIAREHLTPMRILFPQAGSGSSDPFTTMPLSGWKSRIEEEITRWRRDPNYIPILPLPVGHQLIGGQGRAMVLHQEHRVWAEQIVAGMHTPQEFIFGGTSYSGTNVSMRNLENEFINYREETMGLTDWIFDSIGAWMGWERVNKKFRRFRMADDMQRVMIYFQLNQAGKVSDRTLLRELNEDFETEKRMKALEARQQVDDQRRMQVSSAQAQAEAQQVMGRYMQAGQADMLGGATPPGQLGPGPQPAGALPAPGEGGAGQVYEENASQAPAEGVPQEAASQLNVNSGVGGGANILYYAKRKAHELESLMEENPEQAHAHIAELKGKVPQFLGLVMQIMRAKGQTRDTLNPLQQPLPDVKPPRRGPENALV